MPVLQQDVLGLNVAVHDALAVRVVERPGNFLRDAHGIGHGKFRAHVQPVAQ